MHKSTFCKNYQHFLAPQDKKNLNLLNEMICSIRRNEDKNVEIFSKTENLFRKMAHAPLYVAILGIWLDVDSFHASLYIMAVECHCQPASGFVRPQLLLDKSASGW